MKLKEKLLFVTHGFFVGGAEIFLSNLLNSFHRDNVEIIVVALDRKGPVEEKLQYDTVIHLPRRWRFDIGPSKELARIIEEHKITKIFAMGFFSYVFVRLALYGSHSSPKVYISIHTTKPRSKKNFIHSWLISRIIRRKDQIIGICKAQVDYVSKYYHIPIKIFVTIYNGVDTKYFTEKPNNFNKTLFREQYNIPADAAVIVQVAAFRKEKKQTDSIKALALYHKANKSKPYLVFVGKGGSEYEEIARQEVKKLGLTEHIRFCGEQKDARQFYWISDLFTLSSKSVETFSIAALEAMACGLPCVLTDVGGAKEMIIDGVNGFIVPPERPIMIAEAWASIIRNREKYSPGAIRKLVEQQFSLAKMVGQYEEILLQ